MHSFIEHTPPHNFEAEQTVLACLLTDAECFGLMGDLAPRHFYRQAHGDILAAMVALNKERAGVDFVTVGNRLSQQTLSELAHDGGRGYLVDLATSIPTTRFFEHYLRIVLDHATLRDLSRVGATIAAAALDPDAVADDVQAKALALVSSVDAARVGTLQTPAEMVHEYMADLEQRTLPASRKRRSLATGISALDSAWRLLPETMIVLGGRPGMGKSALALAVAWAVAQYAPVLYFSLEMSKQSLIDRLVLSLTGIRVDDLEDNPEEEAKWRLVTAATNRILASGLRIDDEPEVTVGFVTKRAMQMASQGDPPRLIVVDYLQLMNHGKAENQNLAVAASSKGLRQLARKLGATMVALAQLSRDVEKRTDKRPVLSDLRDSGSLEQDADIVALAYRDDYYKGAESKKPNVCEVIMAKFRDGAGGAVAELYFDRTQQQFTSVRPTWGGA